VVEGEEEGDWGGSGDDSEWEPDWKSDDDDDATGFTQVFPLPHTALGLCLPS